MLMEHPEFDQAAACAPGWVRAVGQAVTALEAEMEIAINADR